VDSTKLCILLQNIKSPFHLPSSLLPEAEAVGGANFAQLL
jgi:hypothetical protein